MSLRWTYRGRKKGRGALLQRSTVTVSRDAGGMPVVELRRYTLHPGRLPDLLAVFERHLIEPQEAAGMAVGGTFVDENGPNSFTWFRGFAGHDERVRALEAFYRGPVWARHGLAANATMIDSDDVLLLQPTNPAHQAASAVPRRGLHNPPRPERALVACHGVAADVSATEDWFANDGHAALEEVLDIRVATWRTDPTPNGFPRLPVRDEQVLVWLAVFPDAGARTAAFARLETADIVRELHQHTSWRRISWLAPTARSAHPAASPRPAATTSPPGPPPAAG